MRYRPEHFYNLSCTTLESCLRGPVFNSNTIQIKLRFICHIHNYTEYNEEWNVFSAFNPSKCTHTWSSGQPTLRRPGSSWGFGALLTWVVDTSCQSRDSNPQPWVTSGFKSNSLSFRPRLPTNYSPYSLLSFVVVFQFQKRVRHSNIMPQEYVWTIFAWMWFSHKHKHTGSCMTSSCA